MTDPGEQYRGVFDNCNDAIFIHDLEGNIIDVNKKAVTYFGYPKKKILSLKIKDLHPEYEFSSSAQQFRNLKKKGHIRFDVDFKRKDGSIFRAQVSASIFDFNGTRAVQGTVRDITAFYMTQKALISSEAKMRSLLDSMTDLVFALDRQKRIVFYHASKKSLLYTAPKNFINKRFKDVLPKNVSALFDDGFEENAKGKVARFRYSLLLKQGLFWFSAIMSPIIEDGKFSGSSLVVREITDQKKNEEQKIQRFEELKKIDQFKSSLLRDVAHQLKTPLSIISFSLDICSQELKSREPDMHKIRKYLSISKKNAAMSKKQIESVMQFGQLVNMQGLKRTKIPLKKFISQVISRLRPYADEKGLTIRLNANEKCYLYGNEVQLEALLRNLIENAIKFTKKGEILVDCRGEKDILTVSVIDKGCGLSKEQQEYLFEPYFQVDRTAPGLGLGLAIVKKIADLHGAKLHVHSRKNKGSAFTIIFKR